MNTKDRTALAKKIREGGTRCDEGAIGHLNAAITSLEAGGDPDQAIQAILAALLCLGEARGIRNVAYDVQSREVEP